MLLESVPLCYPSTAAFPANLTPAWQEVRQLSAGVLCVQNIAGLKGSYKGEPYGEVEGQQIKIVLGEVSSQHKKEIFYSHSLKQLPLGHSKSPCQWRLSRCDWTGWWIISPDLPFPQKVGAGDFSRSLPTALLYGSMTQVM